MKYWLYGLYTYVLTFKVKYQPKVALGRVNTKTPVGSLARSASFGAHHSVAQRA